jgi:murein DD-endopeptidase MepM/ murein hydrolase activator NlpD
MSRLTILTSALAVLALGVGAIGYAAIGSDESEAPPGPQDRIVPQPSREPVRSADRDLVIGSKESLAAALLRAGVGGLDAALAEQAAGSISGPAKLWLGEKVGTGARALERLELRLGGGRHLLLERQGDGFVRRDRAEAVDQTPVRIRLSGGAGLATGLVEAGLPRATRNQVLDQLAGERLAAIDLIVAHEAGTSGSHYGEPIYLGVHLAGGGIRRWFGDGGGLRRLGSDEAAPAGLLRPLPGPVTSNPGLRFHPILRYLRWHRGTDFASPAGTPVQAALGGRVIDAGWKGGYGRTVRIADADGSTTLYAHLSHIEVASGEEVVRGAVIGAVGSTGLATGPHLHFELQRNGAMLQPYFGQAQIAGAAVGAGQQAQLRALLSAPFRLPPQRRS